MIGLRSLHRWFGLGAAAFGLVLAITGALLALDPVLESATTGRLAGQADVSVATLAQAVVAQVDGAERIEVTPNNSVYVHFSNDEDFGRVAFDPVALKPLAPVQASPVWAAIQDLHRSFFLGEFGRGIAGFSALALLVLTVSGATLMVRRMGGWKAFISPPKAGRAQSLHLDMARVAFVGLALAASTGVFLSLATFELLPSTSGDYVEFPMVDGDVPTLQIGDLPVLKSMPLAELKDLVFPYPDDPTDAYQIKTTSGSGYIDPTTGEMSGFAPAGTWEKVSDMIFLLHTGQGAWIIGLFLGLAMLAVPFVIVSGVIMAVRRPRSPMRGIKSSPARQADVVMVVGSEGATTWGYAAELARKLTAAKKTVHIAPMNGLGTSYPNARHLIVLTATYGNGEAPANATRFTDRLQDLQSAGMEYTVLGFGDRSFQHYCKFADDTEAALAATGMKPFHDVERIDRHCAQTFASWGRSLGAALGIDLDLEHIPAPPKTVPLRLISKNDFGKEVQAPVSILRFRTKGSAQLPSHSAGDLLGVIALGTTVPRFYSLASSSQDGWIEICVRKRNGGVCSGFLTDMAIGDGVQVFVKQNPEFHLVEAKTPLILIGAGAGIGPLVGFLRRNAPGRETHLYWGGRDQNSDFLYREELDDLRRSGQLSRLTTTFSRSVGGGYVQAAIERSADEIRALIQSGAQVLVCGGVNMGSDVRDTFDGILQPINLNTAALSESKRYLEDVY